MAAGSANGAAAAGEAVEDEEGAKAMAKAKGKRVTCDDCYFRKNMLCALNLTEPCTTFRPAERDLAPERQLAFVFRTERTRAAYAFPQPN